MLILEHSWSRMRIHDTLCIIGFPKCTWYSTAATTASCWCNLHSSVVLRILTDALNLCGTILLGLLTVDQTLTQSVAKWSSCKKREGRLELLLNVWNAWMRIQRWMLMNFDSSRQFLKVWRNLQAVWQVAGQTQVQKLWFKTTKGWCMNLIKAKWGIFRINVSKLCITTMDVGFGAIMTSRNQWGRFETFQRSWNLWNGRVSLTSKEAARRILQSLRNFGRQLNKCSYNAESWRFAQILHT